MLLKTSYDVFSWVLNSINSFLLFLRYFLEWWCLSTSKGGSDPAKSSYMSTQWTAVDIIAISLVTIADTSNWNFPTILFDWTGWPTQSAWRDGNRASGSSLSSKFNSTFLYQKVVRRNSSLIALQLQLSPRGYLCLCHFLETLILLKNTISTNSILSKKF